MKINPKNIILDLGGVLLNLDYQKTIDAFIQLGIKDFDELYTQLSQEHLFDEYEKGNINCQDFINGLKNYLPSEVTEQEIIDAWNAMLLDFPKERIELLEKLNSMYNLVLLSNTNKIHVEAFLKILEQENGHKSLDPFFNTVYYSCDMGMRKPDAEIFEKVCELEGFLPEETIFIDDSPQHVEGAKSIGINAFYLDVEKSNVINLLDDILL